MLKMALNEIEQSSTKYFPISDVSFGIYIFTST